MADHTIIKKLIEREERYMTDAAERQDAEDAQFYKIRKQAFEEVEPFFRQLLDESKKWKAEYLEFYGVAEAQAKEIEQLQSENERLLEQVEEVTNNWDACSNKYDNIVQSQAKEIERLQNEVVNRNEQLLNNKYKIEQLQANKAALQESVDRLTTRTESQIQEIQNAYRLEKITDDRAAIAAAYWLDASPHEQTIDDGIILAKYARQAMEDKAAAVEALKQIKYLPSSHPYSRAIADRALERLESGDKDETR